MVPITSLVLPIVVSAVVVFVASSIIHMALPYHRSDMRMIPGGKSAFDGLVYALLTAGVFGSMCLAEARGELLCRKPRHRC
jgi:hypothetical protein